MASVRVMTAERRRVSRLSSVAGGYRAAMKDPENEKLDQVQEDIDRVRRDAEEHGTLPSDPEPTLVDPDADGEEERTQASPP